MSNHGPSLGQLRITIEARSLLRASNADHTASRSKQAFTANAPACFGASQT